MKDEQYNILRKFPLDKSWLNDKETEDIIDRDVDYNERTEIYNELHKAGFVEGGLPEPGLRITPKGISALYEYEEKQGFWNKLYEKKWWIFWGTVVAIILAALALLL
ncbi:MAG: hypothetical protein E6H08_13595 [Bacteroidetes bacterium]|nr:MAG: hypothetical protein E6H08_13595 [Bacteroidota bacterium]